MQSVELTHNTFKRRLGVLLRPVLPPKLVQFLRYALWCGSVYFPRLVTSGFAKRTPKVRGFGPAQGSSPLAKQLEDVNVLAPTKMCRIMTKYGSDKGRLNYYTPVYSALFKDRCNEPLRIFELGLGTNNTELPSNMGPYGAPGASLRGWRELFPQALVYGADVDRGILFQEDRIKTFYCNQLDQSSIRDLWSNPGLQEGADILIEDGLHTLEANISFLEGSLRHLRPGGIYVTEDIMLSDVESWYDRLGSVYSKQYPAYEFAFAVIARDGSGGSNNLLVIRRKPEGSSL
jgi:hypothetical protein